MEKKIHANKATGNLSPHIQTTCKTQYQKAIQLKKLAKDLNAVYSTEGLGMAIK